MEINELHLNDYVEIIKNAIANQQDSCFYSILPKNIVYRGKGDIDEKYCKANGFEIYNSIDFGGGIVGFEGDIVLVILKSEGWALGINLMQVVCNYLRDIKHLNATIEGNDILIDGIYKVASFSSVNVGNRVIYTGIQVTFSADKGIIDHICLKGSVKIPRGLNYYSVTNSEVWDILRAQILTI